jgi:homoserine O-acetyltransferase
MIESPQPSFEADYTFAHDLPFALSGGGSLQPVTLRYATYGTLNTARDNAILVCHALSGNARIADWWPELFGDDMPFDLRRFCIICSNVIGSCYGSTGPTSINPQTGAPYGPDFPVVSIHDMVRAQARLLDHLGVQRLHAVVGGSIGGMQALSWAVQFPERLSRCAVIGAAPLNAMALALNHLQRQVIRNDPDFCEGRYTADRSPRVGLALARALAMCTYKSPELLQERFARRPNRGSEKPDQRHHDRYDVAGYLDYQGQLFVNRFDANSYLAVSKAMDTFELGRTPEELRDTLGRIRTPMLLVGILSDWLFPPAEICALAEQMTSAGVDARYAELVSMHGHDGFLAEADQLAPLLTAFLQS